MATIQNLFSRFFSAFLWTKKFLSLSDCACKKTQAVGLCKWAYLHIIYVSSLSGRSGKMTHCFHSVARVSPGAQWVRLQVRSGWIMIHPALNKKNKQSGLAVSFRLSAHTVLWKIVFFPSSLCIMGLITHILESFQSNAAIKPNRGLGLQRLFLCLREKCAVENFSLVHERTAELNTPPTHVPKYLVLWQPTGKLLKLWDYCWKSPTAALHGHSSGSQTPH